MYGNRSPLSIASRTLSPDVCPLLAAALFPSQAVLRDAEGLLLGVDDELGAIGSAVGVGHVSGDVELDAGEADFGWVRAGRRPRPYAKSLAPEEDRHQAFVMGFRGMSYITCELLVLSELSRSERSRRQHSHR